MGILSFQMKIGQTEIRPLLDPLFEVIGRNETYYPYEDSKIVSFGQKQMGILSFQEKIGQTEIIPLLDPLFEVTGRRKFNSLMRTRKS